LPAYYAAVLLGRITALARPSVLCRWGSYLESKKAQKNQN